MKDKHGIESSRIVALEARIKELESIVRSTKAVDTIDATRHSIGVDLVNDFLKESNPTGLKSGRKFRALEWKEYDKNSTGAGGVYSNIADLHFSICPNEEGTYDVSISAEIPYEDTLSGAKHTTQAWLEYLTRELTGGTE